MRTIYTFFQGRAERAGPRLAADLGMRRAQDALTSSAAQLPPVDGLALNRGTVARLAPPAALRPCRATAASARTQPPRPTERAGRRYGSAMARGLQTGPSLRRPHPEALRARGQGRSLRSRRCAIPSGPWTATPQGFRGYRRDGQGLEYALTASWQINPILAIIKLCLPRRFLLRTGMRSVSNFKRPWVLYAIGKC